MALKIARRSGGFFSARLRAFLIMISLPLQRPSRISGCSFLFPTLLLALSIGEDFLAMRFRKFYDPPDDFLPGSADLVKKNLEAISQVSSGLLITALTILLWAGSWIFTVIERAVCRMWGTKPRLFFARKIFDYRNDWGSRNVIAFFSFGDLQRSRYSNIDGTYSGQAGSRSNCLVRLHPLANVSSLH